MVEEPDAPPNNQLTVSISLTRIPERAKNCTQMDNQLQAQRNFVVKRHY